MSNRHRATSFAAAVGMTLLLAAPKDLDAQTVLGRVLERGGGGAVAGAMVRLQAGGAATGASWLSGADGRFRLQAPAGGSYEIEVERIGFATTVVDDVTVAEDGLAVIDIVVEPRPLELRGLHVSAEGRRCEADSAGAGVAQVLWDEARKALAAATWTQARSDLRFVVSVWDRELSTRTSQILHEETGRRETVGGNSVRSLPADRLLAEGYVHFDPAYTSYYAPDAEALLSDEFQRSHCFRVVEPEDESPYLGLEFEPDEDRDLPDVAGTIWIDRVNGRLDRVDFRYTGLDVAGAALAKGTVAFAELMNGQWIVREWLIRAPMAPGAAGAPGLMRRSELRIHEVGNSVELVEGQGVLWRPDIAPGVVRGTVFDSISGGPFAGATVRVGARNLRATTDRHGRFELKGLAPGLHRVTFDHPRLDTLGVSAGWRTVEMRPGAVAGLELATPMWTTLLARSCGDGAAGVLTGIVYARSGEVVAGATVELGSRTETGTPIMTRSDARGGYVLCAVEPGVARVSARLGGAESTAVQVRVDHVGTAAFARADLTLLPGVAAAAVPGVLRPALVGTVMAQGTRRPLEGVAVELRGPRGEPITSTISDEDGHFSAVLEAGAEVHVSVSRLGYTGAVSERLALREGTRRIEVLLPEQAIEREPVMVVVDSRLPVLERVGFYERAVTHPGAFIQRDDVAAISPARSSDLLGRVPGVRVTTDTSGARIRRRVLFNRLALLEGELCYPALFVDDELMRIGGSRAETGGPAIQGVEPLAGEDVPSLDELVPPHEIIAVELYENAARLPSRFTGLGTRCGVIAIWTTRAG